MKKYIFSKFNLSKKYKKELIEFVENMCNAEIGGNRFYDGTGTHYMQNPKEIVDLVFALKRYEKKRKKKFNSFLEIGYAAGVNNSFLNKLFNFKNSVSIDIVGPTNINTSTFYSNLRFKNIVLICGDSTSFHVIQKAILMGPYDFIFVDGGHTYDVIKKDFQNYSKALSKNGVIAFHDIKSNVESGPPKFWSELKKKHRKNWNFFEFFDPGHHTVYGIGLAIKK